MNLERFSFEPGLAVNQNIPTPASFLGYELGEHSTYYSSIENYIKELSKKSDRLKLVEYGKHMKIVLFIYWFFHLQKI